MDTRTLTRMEVVMVEARQLLQMQERKIIDQARIIRQLQDHIRELEMENTRLRFARRY